MENQQVVEEENMDGVKFPVAVSAFDSSISTKPTAYPEPFASRVAGRVKRPLGDLFGLTNFGVNMTRLLPGAVSALRHAHTRQDEFIFVLEGTPTLVTDAGETVLSPGMCAGFKAGNGDAHHLINRTNTDVVLLEVGDRSAGDAAEYPDDDIQAVLGVNGKWKFTHKNGVSY